MPSFPSDYVWTWRRAQKLLVRLKPALEKVGWSCGVTGRVCSSGHSDNDLDLVVFPFNTTRPHTLSQLREALASCGLSLKVSREEMLASWKRRGITDQKHVEVYVDREGRRVDVITFANDG